MKLITKEQPVKVVSTGFVILEGDLTLPESACGMVLFAHGSGSSRHSSRNKYVANVLNEAGLGTLLIDLLTPEEERIDKFTGQLRFNIGMLSERLVGASEWLIKQDLTRKLKIGLFGASTGGGAALVTTARRPDLIDAVVSRGGRPDLAGDNLKQVSSPTLLIVGGFDYQVIELNQSALQLLDCLKNIEIVPGATHLFEEPGTLEKVAILAKNWFLKYLGHRSV